MNDRTCDLRSTGTGVAVHGRDVHPQSPADVAAHALASYVRPLPPQTRSALLAELRAAVAREDWDTVLEIELAAVAEDRAHPGQPRLMDQVRGIVDAAKAVSA